MFFFYSEWSKFGELGQTSTTLQILYIKSKIGLQDQTLTNFQIKKKP